ETETLWLARGVEEPVALSQGRFGILEGLPRILSLLRAAEVRASFFIPAWVAEHYPSSVRAIAGDGHEIGCHGDVHERVTELERGREQAILKKSLDVLTPLAGRRPMGYRPPAWAFLSHTPVNGRALVEIPVPWVLDDAPYFLFTGQRAMQPPGPVLQGWLTEFEGITAMGGVTNFTFHPQIIGRPSRLACLQELIDHARHTPRL